MAEAAYAVSAPRRLNKQLAPLSRDNPPGRDRRASRVLPRPQPLIRSARPQVKNISFISSYWRARKRFEPLTPRFVVWCRLVSTPCLQIISAYRASATTV